MKESNHSKDNVVSTSPYIQFKRVMINIVRWILLTIRKTIFWGVLAIGVYVLIDAFIPAKSHQERLDMIYGRCFRETAVTYKNQYKAGSEREFQICVSKLKRGGFALPYVPKDPAEALAMIPYTTNLWLAFYILLPHGLYFIYRLVWKPYSHKKRHEDL